MDRKSKRVVCILFLFCILFGFSCNTYAAINKKYDKGSKSNVVELDKKIEDDPVIKAIAELIYSIASLVENLTAGVFEGLTKQRMFPWADKIVFNTIPLLDINFFNPSDNSLFKTTGTGEGADTAIAKVIRNIYFSIYVLAIGFLGIIVGVMAIKLATSTLASQKAKYKQAIVSWILAIILLFTAHYLLSFIFYVNEKMVVLASHILNDQLNDANNVSLTSSDKDMKGKVVAFLVEQIKAYHIMLIQEETLEPYDLEGKLANKELTLSELLKVCEDAPEGRLQSKEVVINLIKYVNEGDNFKYAYRLIDSEEYRNECLTRAAGQSDNEGFAKPLLDLMDSLGEWWLRATGDSNKTLKNFYMDLKCITNESDEFILGVYGDKIGNIMLAAKNKVEADVDSKSNIIAGLGEWFKESAWSYKDSEGNFVSWSKPSRPVIQNAILYAIFVLQSLMYFFAYLKRFFYVIILAMLAPFIIVYDFFSKIAM